MNIEFYIHILYKKNNISSNRSNKSTRPKYHILLRSVGWKIFINLGSEGNFSSRIHY